MKHLVSDIYNCNVVELTKIHNPAGNITIIQNGAYLPFEVKRVFYLYDIPGGTERGGHAHQEFWQLIVAASGSFEVILDDGFKRKIVGLNQPHIGLIIVPGIWVELVNFSSGAICLVLTSEKYIRSDYIRDYSEFKKLRDQYNAG